MSTCGQKYIVTKCFPSIFYFPKVYFTHLLLSSFITIPYSLFHPSTYTVWHLRFVVEPDLADALLKAKILEEQISRTPDSYQTVHYYKVNQNVLSQSTSGTVSGVLDIQQAKCLQAPIDGGEVTWYVSHVADSNSFLLVVDGYRRQSTECTFRTVSKPPTTRNNIDIIDSCSKQKQIISQATSWQTKSDYLCPRCDAGEYAAMPNMPCAACPAGTYSRYSGSASCTNCSIGMYNEVSGQNQCRQCTQGRYSSIIGASFNPCKTCPVGAICSGLNNLETSIIAAKKDPATDNSKDIFVSFWRDPLIQNQTGTASTCFYKCVEPRACLGSLICRDDDNGVGTYCHKKRDEIAATSPTTIRQHQQQNNSGAYTIASTTTTENPIMNYTNFSSWDTSSNQYECSEKTGESCVVIRLKEECAVGYRGVTCAGCDVSYYRQGTQCAPCPDRALSVLGVVGGALLCTLLYTFLIYSTLKGYGHLPREGIIMRVISSNILIVSMLKDLEIKWPPAVLSMMSGGAVGGDPTSLLNLECLWAGPSTENQKVMPYIIVKAIVALLMPFLFVFILGTIFGTKHFISERQWNKRMTKQKKLNDQNGAAASAQNDEPSQIHGYQGNMFSASLDIAMAKRFANKAHHVQNRGGLMSLGSVVSPYVLFQSALVVIAYMLYPSLLKNTFGLIECVRHHSVSSPETDCTDTIRMNQEYFFRDQSVKCFDEQHHFVLATIFAPSVLLYVVLIPIVFFWQLRKHVLYIFAGPTLKRVVWGFVTSGFEQHVFYWELVVLSRKAVLGKKTIKNDNVCYIYRMMTGYTANSLLFFSSSYIILTPFLTLFFYCCLFYTAVFIMVFLRASGPLMTSLCCILALLLALVLHSQFLPFIDYHIDLLEKISIVCSTVMIILGMMLNYTTEMQGLVVMVCIIVINVLFFGVAIYMYANSKALALLRKAEQDVKLFESEVAGITTTILSTKSTKSVKVMPTSDTVATNDLKTWGGKAHGGNDDTATENIKK